MHIQATKDYQGNTSLHFAAQTPSPDTVPMISALIGNADGAVGATSNLGGLTGQVPTGTKRVDVNETNAQNVTALHVACATCGTHEQSVPAVLTLLSRGADPNRMDKRGLSPLHLLADAKLPGSSSGANGRTLAQGFAKAGADANLQTGAGNRMTALHIAVESGNDGLANALVRSCGAHVSIPDAAGRCALALMMGHAREVNNRRYALLANITTKQYWVPDDALKNCMECGAEFSFSRRRHHCRHCGRLICPTCSPKKCTIEKLGETKKVRVCVLCFPVLTQGVGVNAGFGRGGGAGGFPRANLTSK